MARQDKLFLILKRCFKRDLNFYIWILAAGIVGGVLAAVFAFTLPELSCKELALYLNDFFENIKTGGVHEATLFQSSIRQNMTCFGILLLLSVMVIGVPFIVSFAAVQGFFRSFALFFMFRLYGIKALLFFLVGILPHGLLLIPCYLVLFVLCLKFSASLIREKFDVKNKFLPFLASFLFLFAVSVMATLLQAYIEPFLVQLISPIFLGS